MPSKKKLKAYIKKLAMPPKSLSRRESQEPASPGVVGAECDWQGDGWRRNSSTQGTPTGSVPTTPLSVPSTPPLMMAPPPIPAPPSEPQNNLSRDGSSPVPWWEEDNQQDTTIENNSPGPPQQPRHKSTLDDPNQAEEAEEQTWTPAQPSATQQNQQQQYTNKPTISEKNTKSVNLDIPHLKEDNTSRSSSPFVEEQWGTPQEHWEPKNEKPQAQPAKANAQPEHTQPESPLAEEIPNNESSETAENASQLLLQDGELSTVSKQTPDLSDMMENFDTDPVDEPGVSDIGNDQFNSDILNSQKDKMAETGENEQSDEKVCNNNHTCDSQAPEVNGETWEDKSNFNHQEEYLGDKEPTIDNADIISQMEGEFPKKDNPNFEALIKDGEEDTLGDDYRNDNYEYDDQDEEEEEVIEKPKFTIMGDYIGDQEATPDADDIIKQIEAQFPKRGDENFEKVLQGQFIPKSSVKATMQDDNEGWWFEQSEEEQQPPPQKPKRTKNEPEGDWWDQPIQNTARKEEEEEEEEEEEDDDTWWKRDDKKAEPKRFKLSRLREVKGARLPWLKEDFEEESDSTNKVPWWEKDAKEFNQNAIPPPPPLPGMPGAPPPPPPMPGMKKPSKPMTDKQKQHIDNIKKAVRTRPDWHTVLKHIEGGTKLKHISVLDKNDRSRPILPKSRGKGGAFVYDSEKPNAHNELLRDIHRGVRLRKSRTNDRSKPDFKSLGLRKLRRQLTIEEKKKAEETEAMPSSSDEEEDIDHMRDDLIATKNQLENEIKNRKKMERENKILKIDVEALHAEIKKLKRQIREGGGDHKPKMTGEADEIVPKLEKSMSKLRMREEENLEALDFSELDNLETEINNLRCQVDIYKKQSDDYLDKYEEVTQKLIVSENSADEWEVRGTYYEKKFKALQKEQNIELPDIESIGCQTDPIELAEVPPSSPMSGDDTHPFPITPNKSGSRKSFASYNRMESFKEEEEEGDEEEEETEEEEEAEETEEEEEEEEEEVEGDVDEEKAAERKAEREQKKHDRDLKLLINKLDHIKDKDRHIRNERDNLRERIKSHFRAMKVERQEYLRKKDELDEMIKTLKDETEDDEDKDEDDEEEEEEEEEPAPAENEGGGWWFDEPAQKPKKLKKRKKKKTNTGDDDDDEEEEDVTDLTTLDEPVWDDSEDEGSESDDEDNDVETRLERLQERTKNHEERTSNKKKDNYMLKAQIERCEEKLAVEKRRHKRLDEELQMLLSEVL